MPHIIPSTPANDANPISALREDILLGLRAAEDATVGDMTAEEVLSAYDRARRAEVLAEAAGEAESLRQFEPAFGARKSAQISENIGVLRVADKLRRMAGEAAPAPSPVTEAITVEHGLSFGDGNVVMAGSDAQFDDRAIRAGAVRVTRTVSPWTEAAS